MNDRLKALADAGVSIWLDDLSRERLHTGNLVELVRESSVVGVTTNPTIFATAIAKGHEYDDQIRAGGARLERGRHAQGADDRRRADACDVLAATAASGGVDGQVSIESIPTSPWIPKPLPRRPRTCGRSSTDPTR